MKKGALRGLGRVYRRPGTKVWWISYYVDGEEQRESSKTTSYSEAVDLLHERNKERGEGVLVPTADRHGTVDDLLLDLERHYEMRRLPSLRTLRAHRVALVDLDPKTQKLGKDGIGLIPAAKLTTARLTRLVTDWQRADVADATINRRLTSLKRAFRLALLSDPPKVIRVPHIPKLTEHNTREGFFEKGEFYGVLDQLPDDGLRDFVEWAYWTGMRKGEIAKLTWAAFDRETWTLTLAAKDAKSRHARRIPLVGPRRANPARRDGVRRLDCNLIFWRWSDRKPTRVYEFRKSWDTACVAAGVAGRLFHDLRRTGVRNLIRAGVDRKVAMKISGHRTEHVFERYNIDMDADLRDAMQKLARYVEQLPAEPKVVPISVGRC
jgi:integrase